MKPPRKAGTAGSMKVLETAEATNFNGAKLEKSINSNETTKQITVQKKKILRALIKNEHKDERPSRPLYKLPLAFSEQPSFLVNGK